MKHKLRLLKYALMLFWREKIYIVFFTTIKFKSVAIKCACDLWPKLTHCQWQQLMDPALVPNTTHARPSCDGKASPFTESMEKWRVVGSSPAPASTRTTWRSSSSRTGQNLNTILGKAEWPKWAEGKGPEVVSPFLARARSGGKVASTQQQSCWKLERSESSATFSIFTLLFGHTGRFIKERCCFFSLCGQWEASEPALLTPFSADFCPFDSILIECLCFCSFFALRT